MQNNSDNNDFKFNHMEENIGFKNITFDLPKNQSNVIKVIGVGGGGSNAINHMFNQGINGVDFVICNTDSQALQNSGVTNKIQLGMHLTEGLGAGANPKVGEEAAQESLDDIRNMLETNTKMVFITAGMGGGTGTGAAPVIAKMAKELDILTVGIVTMPFAFEGKLRNQQALVGLQNMRNHVDSLIVINNNKLREVYGNLGFKAGFSKADEVLSTAARGIAEVITHHYTQNIDLRDAKTVLKDSGTAIMGSATASGQNRAQKAICSALDSPLLNDNKISGATNVLLLIVSGSHEITIDEIGEINEHIQNETGNMADIIMGVGEDATLGEAISVTIIATGFVEKQQHEITNTESKKVVHDLEEGQKTIEAVSSDVVFQPAPTIHTPVPKVIHNLDMDEQLDEFVETTKDLLNMDVVYDILEEEVAQQDFEFNEVEPQEEVAKQSIDFIGLSREEEEMAESFEYEPQTALTFELPLFDSHAAQPKKQEIVNWNLEEEDPDDVMNISVNEYIVVGPNPNGELCETRYVGGSAFIQFTNYFMDKPEEEMTKVTSLEGKSKLRQEELEEVDPLNTPISDAFNAQNAHRRQKIKEFNYKFSSSRIDEIERTPAYKRQGLDLDQTKPSSESTGSRTTVNLDDSEDIHFRTNNSFLHDNVD